MWNNDIKEKIKKTLSYTAKRDCIITLITCIVVSIVIGAFIVYLRRDEDKTIKVGVVYVGDASTMYTNNFIEALSDIEQEYNIPVSQEFREEVKVMCNLSTGIEERATKEATEETSEKFILNMHRKGYTLEQIADVAETSVDEIEAVIRRKETIIV